MVALGGWPSRRHIPIIDNEGCNFFCIDRINSVSSNSFFFSKDAPGIGGVIRSGCMVVIQNQ